MKIRRYGAQPRRVFAQHRCADARIDGDHGIIFLTMKIVQILGKIVENLPRT
jgi:hypothetical protein